MRTGELKRRIILMFRTNELYGYEINRLLSFQEINLNISRLYGILNEMQTDGLLLERWEKSPNGPRKKMYRLSEKGRSELNAILLEAISIVHLFYSDYLRGLFPEINVFGELIGTLIDGLQEGDCVAYLTHSDSGFHETIISRIQKKITTGKMYMVTPDPSKLNIENLNMLDGDYENLPFKKNYLDRLIIIGVPRFDLLSDAFEEWKRVISERGIVVILSPTILVQKHMDPLSIGDFVEKYEHQVIEKSEPVDPDYFFSALRKTFRKVEQKETIHMSIVTAYN